MRRPYEKIGDCEQSVVLIVLIILLIYSFVIIIIYLFIYLCFHQGEIHWDKVLQFIIFGYWRTRPKCGDEFLSEEFGAWDSV